MSPMSWIRKLFGGKSTEQSARPSDARSRGGHSFSVGDSEYSQPLPEIDPNEPEYDVEIPPIETVSEIGQQYARAPGSLGPGAGEHVTRMREIFSDSIRIALNSKNPETAKSRYDLSLATYHEILAHAAPSPDLDYVTRHMKRVVALHPAMLSINQAIGCMDKAAKLKSTKGKLKRLASAREIMESIPDDIIADRAKFEHVRHQIDEQISLLEPA